MHYFMPPSADYCRADDAAMSADIYALR